MIAVVYSIFWHNMKRHLLEISWNYLFILKVLYVQFVSDFLLITNKATISPTYNIN